MKCPHCHEPLTKATATGGVMLRTRGVVFKSGGMLVVCPKCKGDVQPTADLMKALQNVAVLFFKT